MKIQQLLIIDRSELYLDDEELKDIFDVHEYQYEGRFAELAGFRTTDKSKISSIIFHSEFDGAININNVDILEIENVCM